MDRRLTEHDGRLALRDHVLERATVARAKHGPAIDASAIMRVLEDREVVRYPMGVRFDALGLNPGEFAHAEPLGEHPRQGFCLFVHPAFEARRDLWPVLIAYHIPPVNYGDIAEAEDCELFGATLLGLGVDEYYDVLCELADSIAPAGAPVAGNP
jgi:hypothetical protein